LGKVCSHRGWDAVNSVYAPEYQHIISHQWNKHFSNLLLWLKKLEGFSFGCRALVHASYS
jgi:hypothetical protein